MHQHEGAKTKTNHRVPRKIERSLLVRRRKGSREFVPPTAPAECPGQAIATAIGRVWPEAVQQKCLVHAHSNLRDKVRRRDRADLDIHFKMLREAQGRQAEEEAFDELLDFVSERNAAAALALENRKDALLAFHRLDVPSTLNVTFLSTNLIENVLRNWREATGNVKRWNEKEDMIPRWMASGLLWAEAGFRRIRHAEDLPRSPGWRSPPRPRQRLTRKRSTDRHRVVLAAGT